MLTRISCQCKNLRWLICMLAIVWVVSGCDLDQSVNPFYLSQDVAVDARFPGDWKGVDSEENSVLSVKTLTENSYSVALTQWDKGKKEEVSWTFEGHLFKFGDKLYIDLLPTAFRVSGKKNRFSTGVDEFGFLAALHTVTQVNLDGDKLSLSWRASGDSSSLFKKNDQASREKELARKKRRQATLTMPTEQLQQEVLGGPPDGDSVIELGMHFVPRNR